MAAARRVGRVLVTGGSGFVGRHALDPLRDRGYEVVAPRSSEVDLLVAGAPRQLVLDVRPTHLLHLAWNVEHGAYWESADNDAWLEASRELLDAFAGVRAVTVGTCAEYDWSAPSPFGEDTTPAKPATRYGASKLALSDIAAAHARLFFLHGPAEDPRRLVPSLVRNLLAGEEASTTADRETRDFLHVADVGAALAAIVDSDLRGPVNIGSGQALAIGDLARVIARLIGQPDLLRVGTAPPRPGEPAAIVADVAKLRTATGWAPALSLEDRLAETIAWWRAQSAGG